MEYYLLIANNAELVLGQQSPLLQVTNQFGKNSELLREIQEVADRKERDWCSVALDRKIRLQFNWLEHLDRRDGVSYTGQALGEQYSASSRMIAPNFLPLTHPAQGAFKLRNRARGLFSRPRRHSIAWASSRVFLTLLRDDHRIVAPRDQ